jgi:hypothetical protein
MRKLKVLYMSNNLVKEWGELPCCYINYCIENTLVIGYVVGYDTSV